MAELLIQAKPHWMDNKSQEDVESESEARLLADNPEATEEEKELVKGNAVKYWKARIQIGDIVVIKPNGWEWGKEETLPNYYILKVPNISVEECEYAVKSLKDTTDPQNPVLLKKRKYQIPQQIINQLDNNNGVLTSQVDSTWLSNLIEKTS